MKKHKLFKIQETVRVRIVWLTCKENRELVVFKCSLRETSPWTDWMAKDRLETLEAPLED